MSDKYNHSDNGSKYLIGYLDDDGDNIIRLLCIILPQISGYIQYFDDGGKICLLKLKMIMYIYHALKFRTKLKGHQTKNFIA